MFGTQIGCLQNSFCFSMIPLDGLDDNSEVSIRFPNTAAARLALIDCAGCQIPRCNPIIDDQQPDTIKANTKEMLPLKDTFQLTREEVDINTVPVTVSTELELVPA